MTYPGLVIVDFGSQFTGLILRVLREEGIACVRMRASELKVFCTKHGRPMGLVISGGPQSVHDRTVSQTVMHLCKEVPTLGICFGMQLVSHALRGNVQQQEKREFGSSTLQLEQPRGQLFAAIPDTAFTVWMSHSDTVVAVPQGARVTATTEHGAIAAFEAGTLHAVQFHPEVSHSEYGRMILIQFATEIAHVARSEQRTFNTAEVASQLRDQVGKHHILGAISGGVDSSVLAAFLARYFGNQFHPVLVDSGLMRRNEIKEVQTELSLAGVPLEVIEASSLFLSRLAGVADPEKKRKIIGKTFIDVFSRYARKNSKIRFLAQGTLYPDVIESQSVVGPSHTIKTHHNVGGLPQKMRFDLIEPFRDLYKDEVRKLGAEWGVPPALMRRHPFPGPGLAIRIMGAVTPERLRIVREADWIWIEELKNFNAYHDVWQAFAVLLGDNTVGVMGDARTYASVIALRAVTSENGMTADWARLGSVLLQKAATRIVNEVKGVNRVVYDITSKPPATIEWE